MKELDDTDKRVFKAITPDYDVNLYVLPGNPFAIGNALRKLKSNKWVAFEGRGTYRTVHLTEAGEAVYKAMFA